MPNARYISGWVMIVGVVLLQGCWEEEQFTLVGEGGCRLADGGEGAPTHLAGLSSDECQAECSDENGKCTGVEYNSNSSHCEIHFEPIVEFEEVEGVFCYTRK